MTQGVKGAMSQGERETQAANVVDTLEPYRRLIELQKQMIELAQQHEKTKSECAALRAQLLEAMARPRFPRWISGWRIARAAGGRVKDFAASRKFRAQNRPRTANGTFSQKIAFQKCDS
jgi:hypothetical protein